MLWDLCHSLQKKERHGST
uniref:Uncharacterized protein n=1 Tax=Anguilla anguilla TaxID=7936 RepID=A0A0E9SDR8_ANGAN